MRGCSSVILVFVKAPIAGQVKTRLIPYMGDSAAAETSRILFYRLIRLLAEIRSADIELRCLPDVMHSDFQNAQTILQCALHQQEGDDLGERMMQAVDMGLRKYRNVILIGTDCPEMSVEYLEQSIRILDQGWDAVMGPAEDGGYVLLGLRKSAECLFRGIPWGSTRVATMTRNCLKKLGWTWQELPTLWDVDRPEDMEKLQNYINIVTP